MNHRTTPPALRRTLLSQAVLLALCATPAVGFAQTASTDLGTVQAGAQATGGAGAARTSQERKISKKQVFKSGVSTTVLDRQQIQTAGAFGGAAQALQVAPGVAVSGYGSTGSTKNQISVNGIKQGWGGFSGSQIDNGSISMTFDGVPMANPSTGLWQTDLVPQLGLIQGIGVTYGPGEPADRWFNNVGGQIAFVPVQPSDKFGGTVGVSVGSDSARNLDFVLNTGKHDGWSTVVAGGTGSADSYRTASDGFNSHGSNEAFFLKTRKDFQNGNFSVGLYNARSTAYRPFAVPTQTVPGLTLDGTANTPLYSQQASGFYSTIPGSVWNKNDTNELRILYGKLNVALDDNTRLHNLMWYELEKRIHDHYNNYGLSSPGNLFEHNNPRTSSYGDKLWVDVALPHNLVSVGGFVLKSTYNTRNAFYNPADLVGTSTTVYGSQTTPNAHYRSDYFDQTDLALFAQDKISPIRRLDVTPGIRLINYDTVYSPAGASDFPISYQYAPGNDQGSQPGSTASHHKIETSISANYRALPWLALFGNFAQAYKEPQVGGGGGLFQSTAPIYNLEKSTDYTLGFKMHVHRARYLHDFLLSASYYHLHFQNQYIPLSDANGNYIGDANGDSTYHGVNLSVSDEVAYNLDVFANANFEKAVFDNYVTGGTSYAGLPVSNVPDKTFTVGANYKVYGGGVLWVPGINYQYTGAQYMWSDQSNSPTNQKAPAYGLWNLTLDGTVPMHDATITDLKFHLGVLNALDKQYNNSEFISFPGDWLGGNTTGTYVLGMPGAPRTFYAGLSADF
jgi:iron complex outermembrane receptor protein